MRREARKEKVVTNENPEGLWAVMAERKGKNWRMQQAAVVRPSGRQGALEAGTEAPETGRRKSGETPPV